MNADKAPAILPAARIKPKLTVMGRIVTVEDGQEFTHPMALLIEFDSVGEIRDSIKRGFCEFERDVSIEEEDKGMGNMIFEGAPFSIEEAYGTDDKVCFYTIRNAEKIIASTWGMPNQAKELAQLFAAAPELLDSLKAMLSIYPLGANAVTLAAHAVVDKIEACAAGG